LREQIAAAIAATLAARGPPDEAETWMKDTWNREFRSPSSRLRDHLVPPEAVRVRRAAWRAGRRFRHLQHSGARQLALLQAFARAQRGIDDIGQLLERARPAHERELDHPTVAWPELRDFIASHPWPRIGVADRATLPAAQLVDGRKPRS
jgi:hypothetical protein